jgi:hypothetical protein
MKEFELGPDEQIVIETRKHWFLFLVELLPYVIAVIVPFAIPKILTLVQPLAQYTVLFDFSTPLFRAALGVWLLVIWTGAWGAFTKYFLDVWVLTTQRLVDVDQHRYFSREVSSVLLSRVQDVTTDVTGIIPSLLGYGNISVQSAGATEKFHMQGIPRPTQMRDLIVKYIPEETDQPII